MKILFIRGFNTDLHHMNNHYQNFETFFSFSNYALEYFNYSPDDDIEDVYTKCSQLLKSGTYKIVMAHSLGGCLLMRFCNENNDIAHCKIPSTSNRQASAPIRFYKFLI